MRIKLLMLGLVLFSSQVAKALDFQAITLVMGGNTNVAWISDLLCAYLPMSEGVADAIGALDKTKMYECKAKISRLTATGSDPLIGIYAVTDCKAK